MEIIAVANEIENRIKMLETGRKQLQIRSARRADTIGQYEKVLGVTIMRLKNGVEFTLDDVEISNPPATITERIARAICFQAKIDMEQAETEYKNAVKGLECIQAELNGYQSIFRFLDSKP